MQSSLPSGIACLSLYRFRGFDRVWAFAQMGLARRPLRRLAGLRFVRLMGAGTGAGFTPIPDPGVVAILSVWETRAAADAAEDSPVLSRYAARACEHYRLVLCPVAARGAWGGGQPFGGSAQATAGGTTPHPGARSAETAWRPASGGSTSPDGAPPPGSPSGAPGPILVLTRARVRLRHLGRFWARAPAIQRRLGAGAGPLLTAGLGEVPWINQVTVSVWRDMAAMHRFAHTAGPHLDAIRAVRAGNWFVEELYARFHILAHYGRWGGRDPLAAPTPRLAAE